MKETLKRTMLSLGVLMICAFILPDFTEAWHRSERKVLSIEEMKLLKGDWVQEPYKCVLYGNRKCENWCEKLIIKHIADNYFYCHGTPTLLYCGEDTENHVVCREAVCLVPGCQACGDPYDADTDHYGTGDNCTID